MTSVIAAFPREREDDSSLEEVRHLYCYESAEDGRLDGACVTGRPDNEAVVGEQSYEDPEATENYPCVIAP